MILSLMIWHLLPDFTKSNIYSNKTQKLNSIFWKTSRPSSKSRSSKTFYYADKQIKEIKKDRFRQLIYFVRLESKIEDLHRLQEGENSE